MGWGALLSLSASPAGTPRQPGRPSWLTPSVYLCCSSPHPRQLRLPSRPSEEQSALAGLPASWPLPLPVPLPGAASLLALLPPTRPCAPGGPVSCPRALGLVCPPGLRVVRPTGRVLPQTHFSPTEPCCAGQPGTGTVVPRAPCTALPHPGAHTGPSDSPVDTQFWPQL